MQRINFGKENIKMIRTLGQLNLVGTTERKQKKLTKNIYRHACRLAKQVSTP